MPSLDIVRSELDRLIGEQERRALSFDTRAGLLLAVAGVLIGLPGVRPAVEGTTAQLIAVIGAWCAALVIRPRVSSGLDPRVMRDGYLTQERDHTMIELLDTRIVLYELDQEQIERKARWLARSGAVLVLAALVEVGSNIVGTIG